MTFIGSSARLNDAWGERLQSNKCSVWESRHFLMPSEVYACWSRQRCGMELLGSAANAAYKMQAGLGREDTFPSQTTEKTDQAWDTCRSVCACQLGGSACTPLRTQTGPSSMTAPLQQAHCFLSAWQLCHGGGMGACETPFVFLGPWHQSGPNGFHCTGHFLVGCRFAFGSDAANLWSYGQVNCWSAP